MNFDKKTYGILALIFILCACDKEENIEKNMDTELQSFYNLKVGSFRVYDYYDVDTSTGKENLSIGYRDSTFIQKDTLINTKKHYIITRFQRGVKSREIVFDSARAIYSYPERNLVFTLNKEAERIRVEKEGERILLIGRYALAEAKETVTVPAGIFEGALNFKGTYEVQEGPLKGQLIYDNNYYVQDIGLVKTSTNYFNPEGSVLSHYVRQKRLVKYGQK